MLKVAVSLILAAMSISMPMSTPKTIPETLIVGYANWHQCDDNIIQAVKNGVNVVMWFSIDLSTKDNKPYIARGPDLSCVKQKIQTIASLNLDCIHLISIGGWNSPHPSTQHSVQDMYNEFVRWNDGLFDGFDYDLEGNDDFDNVYNTFTCKAMEFLGEFAQMGKRDGFIVSMAPAESYLDYTNPLFDLSLSHINEWDPIHPNFKYHGYNTYAILLQKYGQTQVGASSIDTFDFIILQLYEGYSHAHYQINHEHRAANDVIVEIVQKMGDGWRVDFSSVPEFGVGECVVRVANTKLVIGLANGWANNEKFLLFYPEQLEKAYKRLQGMGIGPRGFGFWNIDDEGREVDGSAFELTKGLNSFLRIRG